jgi:hypothetical protein
LLFNLKILSFCSNNAKVGDKEKGVSHAKTANGIAIKAQTPIKQSIRLLIVHSTEDKRIRLLLQSNIVMHLKNNVLLKKKAKEYQIKK